MKLNEIILIVLDEPENFFDTNTQLRIGKELYQDVKLVTNRVEFDNVIHDLPEDQKFLFVCHVFHAVNDDKQALRGFLKLLNSGIEDDYNIKATLVSSGDSGEVMKNLYDKEKVERPVFLYTTFRENLKSSKILPYTVSDILFANRSTLLQKKKDGIFLSHSSKDKIFVGKFRDTILQGGLGYDLQKVKFTSQEDHGIPAGVSIPMDLKEFLTAKTGLFIQFISEDYSKSRVCLNEEGAAWCLLEEMMFIPVLVSEFRSEDISWIQTLSKAIRGNDKSSLLNIYEDRKNFFGNEVNVTRLSQKIEEFINSI